MKSLIIAWRNLWRNSRRTWITVSSVFFGVILSTVMSSMQEGSYDSMVDNVVKFYSGYLQVQEKDYWENRTIHESFVPADSLLSLMNDVDLLTHYSPRLENYALAATDEFTKGARVMGVDPENENRITGLVRWIDEGHFLEKGKNGLVIGYELAQSLGLSVNDTLILLGSGFHGMNAAGIFPVCGIIRFPNPELSRDLIYMDLSTCQSFYGADGRVTSLVLMVKDHFDLPEATKQLKKRLPDDYRVMTWDEMQPELVQMIEADRSGAVIMKGILYFIIAFGILGTILMMLSERKREMGVMVAVGMQRSRMGTVLLLETILIGAIGTLAGFAGSIPVIAWFIRHPFEFTGKAAETFIQMGIEPLLYFSWQPSVFTHQALTVFLLTLLIAFVPFYRSLKLKIYSALRS